MSDANTKPADAQTSATTGASDAAPININATPEPNAKPVHNRPVIECVTSHLSAPVGVESVTFTHVATVPAVKGKEGIAEIKPKQKYYDVVVTLNEQGCQKYTPEAAKKTGLLNPTFKDGKLIGGELLIPNVQLTESTEAALRGGSLKSVFRISGDSLAAENARKGSALLGDVFNAIHEPQSVDRIKYAPPSTTITRVPFKTEEELAMEVQAVESTHLGQSIDNSLNRIANSLESEAKMAEKMSGNWGNIIAAAVVAVVGGTLLSHALGLNRKNHQHKLDEQRAAAAANAQSPFIS